MKPDSGNVSKTYLKYLLLQCELKFRPVSHKDDPRTWLDLDVCSIPDPAYITDAAEEAVALLLGSNRLEYHQVLNRHSLSAIVE